MVGATLPTAPSVRIANSRQFSMLNRKCDHCLRSSVRVHFVSARPEVRRFLLAKRILYIHYGFLPLFSREQYGPFPCRLRLVFVSSPCLAGRLTLFIYYLLAFRHDYFPVTAFFISMHQRVDQRFADGSMCRRLIYALDAIQFEWHWQSVGRALPCRPSPSCPAQSCRRWHWRKRNNSPTNSEEYRLWLTCIRQSGLPVDLSMKRILSS